MIWFSNTGRSGFGCCALPLLLVPLSMFGFGFGGDMGVWLLLAAGAALFVMYGLPMLTGGSTEKRKNDSLDDYEKSKRGQRTVLTEDGELLDVVDDDPSARGRDVY